MTPVNPPSQPGPSWAGRRQLTPTQARAAARRGWDLDAARYQREHSAFLSGPHGSDLVWCPEGWLESEVQLLGDPQHLADAVAVDLGCGAGQAARWLAGHCRHVIGIDVSHEQLAHGLPWFTDDSATLIQADAHELPLPDDSVDVLVSAFGVMAFVTDLRPVFAEIARVLAPGAHATVSMPHPMRWLFPDDPNSASLTVTHSYFDRTPYVEADSTGAPTYAECHHTLADVVNAIADAGLLLCQLWEPDWRADADHVWGGWSAETAALVAKTLIIRAEKL